MFAPSVFSVSVFAPSVFPPGVGIITPPVIPIPPDFDPATGGSDGERFGGTRLARELRERQQRIIQEDDALMDLIVEFIKKL